MEVITDIEAHKERIMRSIERYASAAEHNYYCYAYNIEQKEIPHVFFFDDDCTILGKQSTSDNEWYAFTEILAPPEKKAQCMKEMLEYAFAHGAVKVWFELETQTRKDILAQFKVSPFKDLGYKINPINYSLTWPVFEMAQWTGDIMAGKEWKDIRYYWNKFFREHKVEFVDSKKSDKEEMKQLVYRWKKERTGTDRTFIEYYLHAIDHDFAGYDHNRIMIVDGKIAGITAGFKVAGRSYYYSSIGIIGKEFDRAGEIANMDDLINLKKLGYTTVDFGGGEDALNEFKKKFHPTRYYDTHIFSIVKKPSE